MNFLNPLLLLGMLAASLPIIIHLINRRRAVRRPFPAMEFLLRSQKKLARRLKVRQFLLLLMRVMALLLLPLAMARPYFLSDDGETDADRVPTGVVFVVDDSASMGYGDGERWARTQELVEARLDRLRPWDRVGLVFGGAWPGGEPLGESEAILELTDDPGAIGDVLARRAPSQRATDLMSGLRSASEALANADMSQKQIVLVSDLQKKGSELDELPAGGFGAPVSVIDVSQGEAAPNLAIVDAEYEQQTAGSRPEFVISATVQNFGEADVTGVEVRLAIEGQQIAAGLVDVPAGKSATKNFTHTFNTKGLHRAKLSLAPGADKHAVDNEYYLPVQLAQKVRVLMVNGDPRSVPYQDELFYLERALRPSARSASVILSEVTGVDGLASHPFKDFDVVVLANVEKIPRTSVVQLGEFVEQGGGLLFIAGPNMRPESANSLYGELLPKPLRSVKRLASREDPDAPVKIVRFGTVDRTHPIFRVFDLPGGETVHAVPVFSYMLLEPTPTDDSKVLMSYGDGSPALLEKSLGEGRVALMTTTIDRDWTDFPIRTAYLPLMRRLMQYLARRSTSGHATNHAVGARVRLEVQPQDRGRVEVRDPEDERIVLTPESTDEGAPLTFVARKAGHYKVVVAPDLPGGELRELEELAFSVNVDPDEADLSAVSMDEFLAALSGEGGEGEGGGAQAAVLDTPEKRVGIWSILLFLVTLVLLGETVLGTRRSVLVRLWRRLTGQTHEVEV